MPNRPKKLQKERAKQMFIYGVEKDGVVVYPTLDEMARELGVNRITIWRWAKEEGWHKEREEVQRQREQSLKESLAKHLQTKADEQAESIAERLMKAKSLKACISSFVLSYQLKRVVPSELELNRNFILPSTNQSF